MKRSLLLCMFLISAFASFAQVDTVSYPKEREELRAILHHTGPGTEKSCGDLVAVGPKGDISFSRQEWKNVQSKEQLVFRAVHIVPGTEVIRVYDGTTGVVNLLLDVALTVAGKDIDIKVRRLEVYHKTNTGWCIVAGQGTQVDEQLFPVH